METPVKAPPGEAVHSGGKALEFGPEGADLESPGNSGALISPEERIAEFRELRSAGFLCLDGDFFPSVHYPPITMYPPITQEAMFKGYDNPEGNRFDIYVHLPFCITCCTFCHYPGKYGYAREEEKDHYLEMLEKEMDISRRVLGVDKFAARSILIGGGTPTFLTPEQLERFLRSFAERVDLRQRTQFNYDVDPKTLLGAEGRERLEIMRSFGVDRLTIGVQSLNDEILRKMNRNHDAREALEAIRATREMGFQVNIEFIFGYPGLTTEIWREDMEKAVGLGVEEIQLYRLKVVPYGDRTGTITRKFSDHEEEFVPVEEALRMKQTAINILAENGYTENLRRVYTKEKKHFSHYAHNQCCNLFDQIGFGLTAFSSLRDRFVLNTQSFEEYYDLVGRGRLPLNRGLTRSFEDQLRWHLILPLKNREVHKKRFFKRTGMAVNDVFGGKIERLKKYGLLVEDERRVALTPLGAFFADESCQVFHDPKYLPFPRSAYAPAELNPYWD
jgi:oxygen-independent coproporphyrinogen-3 oxidase